MKKDKKNIKLVFIHNDNFPKDSMTKMVCQCLLGTSEMSEIIRRLQNV